MRTSLLPSISVALLAVHCVPPTPTPAPSGDSGLVASRNDGQDRPAGMCAPSASWIDAGFASPFPLTADQLQQVVACHQREIRRACVDRFADADAGNASANETVRLTIAAGRVTQATAAGDDARMGRCLEEQVKTWLFPPGGSAVVNVPFRFVRP